MHSTEFEYLDVRFLVCLSFVHSHLLNEMCAEMFFGELHVHSCCFVMADMARDAFQALILAKYTYPDTCLYCCISRP